MKAGFAILSIFFIYQLSHVSGTSEKKHSPNKQFLSTDTSHFKKYIQPIFEKHCSPCHFVGGKMYEKLPFDEAQTIINNKTGILRRIKDDSEKTLIITFVEEHKPESK